jgi:hypothetical protein
MHRTTHCTSQIILFFVFMMTSLLAYGQTQVSLSQLRERVQSQLAQQHGALTDTSAVAVQRWLDGPVTLQLSTLQSTEAGGSDEYEIAVNMPMSSAAAVGLKDEFKVTNDNLLLVNHLRQQLSVSGIVRNLVWERTLAQQKVTSLEDKLRWFDTFRETLQKQGDVGELSRIALLVWQQNYLLVKRELLAARSELSLVKAQYVQLTGLQDLPLDINEGLSDKVSTSPDTHPDIRALQLEHQLALQTFNLSTSSNQGWQLGLMAKQLESNGFSEQQVGVSVGIPLGFTQSTNVQSLATWKQAEKSNAMALMNRRIDIQQSLRKALAQQQLLQQQIILLEQEVALGQQIQDQWMALNTASELAQGAWLTELIRQKDLTYELAKTRLLLNQQNARINQISGIPL